MAHFLAFGWSGHGDYSFNCDRVELGAIHSGNMAHEGGFANKEFHLVEIQLDMTLFKSPKHADKDAIVVDWTSLAPEPGIKMPSVIQKPRRPSSTIWIWSCHSLDAEVMPNGCLVHLWRPHGVNIVVIRDDLKDKGLFCLFESYSFHAACECFFFPRWRWYTLDIEWLYWGSEKGLSSSVFSRFGGGWFSLSVEIPLPAGQWFHTHPGPLWSHPALKWASSDWGHGWVWHLDPGQDRRVGCGSPDLERVRSSSWKWIPEFKSLV